MPVLGLLFRDRKTTVKLGDAMRLSFLIWNGILYILKEICFIGL
ncbi:hypothetical protein HMPREF3213_03826 [Heyndrickxia coagulans]|uniref:Uncharacterized protein n=1 Tax=Heyndrickxia coagulans TaxID=1398 RepID=A0A133KAG0_HEYCO|nr:hypothetical protein HMPREF3213_03826 [Heyndrickxia coagulans]